MNLTVFQFLGAVFIFLNLLCSFCMPALLNKSDNVDNVDLVNTVMLYYVQHKPLTIPRRNDTHLLCTENQNKQKTNKNTTSHKKD